MVLKRLLPAESRCVTAKIHPTDSESDNLQDLQETVRKSKVRLFLPGFLPRQLAQDKAPGSM